MVSTNSFDPSTTIKFVVKNNSSMKRSIKVFNTSLPFGATLDCMKIPGVSEEDVRFAVTKGNLKPLIEGGALIVVECSVNLNTTDMAQSAFVRTNIPTVCRVASLEALKQSTWYIDPVEGNDNSSGMTPNAALKTFKEWQHRVGDFTTLTPTATFLNINIMNDLPPSDPITFRNTMGRGHSCFINGTEKVLATSTLTGTINKDRSTNTPYQVTVAGLNWDDYIGKKIVITSGQGQGSGAYILRNMGSNTAHVSEWMSENTFFDGGTYQSDAPTTGSGFKVVDYTNVTVGATLVGYEENLGIYDAELDYWAPVGGLILQRLHMELNFEEGTVITVAPSPIFSSDTVGGFAHSIIDSWLLIPDNSTNCGLANVLLRGGCGVADGAVMLQFGGAYLPTPDAGYPGGVRVERGGHYFSGADVSFVGTIGGDVFQAADIQCEGVMEYGVMSFWNSWHTLFPLPGGIIWNQNSDAWGDGQLVDHCLWGTGNGSYPVVFPGGKFMMNQFKFNDGYTPTYPTIELGTFFPQGADGYLAILGSDNGPSDPNANDTDPGAFCTAYAFNGSTGAFTAPRYMTWANMNTPVTSGGFLVRTTNYFPGDGGKYVERISTACDPSINAAYIFGFAAYVP